MKRIATVSAVLISVVMGAGAASAALRSPQVVVNGGTLQGYLNSVGESINVSTDQDAVQSWLSTDSNNSTFTFQIELTGNAAANTLGIYNGSVAVPPLYQLFPGAATSGWFAVASFRSAPTRVIVSLFDANAAFQGSTTYLAGPPDKNDFGFYLMGPGGTFYMQDARNPGGKAQMLAFAGTGPNSGSWWAAFEDGPVASGADADYDDAVLFLESVNPTPVNTTTWGSLKVRFR